MSQFWPKGGSPGILHHYTETLITFEFTSSTAPQPHSILFLGGLGDGLGTTSYASDVVDGLKPTEWSFFTLNLTSSYQSWGLGSLDRDTDEIAACLKYIKAYKTAKYGAGGKIVLMGHSTGSQCVLHYLHRPNPHTSTPAWDPDLEHVERPVLDGAIMQAPVSDREAILYIVRDGFLGKTPGEMKEVLDELVAISREAAAREDQSTDVILPLTLTPTFGYSSVTPISARRFLSLASPGSPQSPSEDDLFSSDLSDEQFAKTFGRIADRGLLRNKLMVLMSGKDQAIPEWVDKEKLLARFAKAADKNGERQVWDSERSGLIPGASHAMSNDDQAEPRKFLVKKVLSYLAEVKENASE
ncbi:hypothetical protein B0T25DRAFT_456027 [Lasiosphaeria hispida]|uniref:Siderophore biosynthesis lipase/esterase n=1 Tax=Lasiosphaeria hispida TaxID=260671 RepID=A0AAJ0HJY5_9PEZI|nr:hypothetical protein B0T25DRAFT_456027 [Lasiosphaeria hispida]